MDVLPCVSIFNELQLIHDTGYFSSMPSLEENWQQVLTTIKSSKFAVSFQGISLTGSAFIFLRWFKLALICT